jgi:hypothetical protein
LGRAGNAFREILDRVHDWVSGHSDSARLNATPAIEIGAEVVLLARAVINHIVEEIENRQVDDVIDLNHATHVAASAYVRGDMLVMEIGQDASGAPIEVLVPIHPPQLEGERAYKLALSGIRRPEILAKLVNLAYERAGVAPR